MTDEKNCPCGSGLALDACCGPYVSQQKKAPTAEALMRSRYTAYVMGNIDYVQATLAAETRHDFDPEGAQAWSENSDWQGLDIHGTEAGGADDAEGMVDFTARFAIDGVDQIHREQARFRKDPEGWVYLDGDIKGNLTVRREAPKVGRNEPCPCGSGKKFKKCCGR